MFILKIFKDIIDEISSEKEVKYQLILFSAVLIKFCNNPDSPEIYQVLVESLQRYKSTLRNDSVTYIKIKY